MAKKNGQDNWYNYVDINTLLMRLSNNKQDYHIIEAASQDNLHILQRINQAFTALEDNPLLPAVIPINLGNVVSGVYEGSHWVGLVVKLTIENGLEAFYNDSFGTPMDKLLPNLRQILKNHGVNQITDFKQLQQINGYDCGPWTVFNIDSIARNKALPNISNDSIRIQREQLEQIKISNAQDSLLSTDISKPKVEANDFKKATDENKGNSITSQDNIKKDNVLGKQMKSNKVKKIPQGKESELTTKVLKKILQGNEDLSQFKDALYERVKEHNKIAGTDHNRAEESRRLDAIARLLVGEETCVAVAFDSDQGKIYISSNRNDHRRDSIKLEVKAIVSKGKGNNTINIKPVTYLYYDDKFIKKIESDREIEYQYQHPQARILCQVTVSPYGELKSILPIRAEYLPETLSSSQNLTTEHVISYTEHEIPDLPDITIRNILFRYIPPIDPRYAGSPQEVQCISGNTKIDLLTRRIEKLIEHLQFVALIAFREKEGVFEQTKIDEAKQICQRHRVDFLKQSLYWEAKKWAGAQGKPYDKWDESEGMLKFIETLMQDFTTFMHSKHNPKVTGRLVESWKDKVIHKIKTQKFIVPKFVDNKPEDFMNKAWRYFCDIEKLEAYITEDVAKGGLLSDLLLKESGPYQPKKSIEVVDLLENNVHAEMRLLYHFIETGSKKFYIAITKLCCALCHLAVKIVHNFDVAGTHGKGFEWLLSQECTNEEFLQKFLGEDLFQKFKTLNGTIIYQKSTSYNKQKLALKIIEAIAQFNGGVDNFSKNMVEDYAEESDDEDNISPPASIESILLPYPFDFDITGKLPFNNDNPCLATRDECNLCGNVRENE